MTRHLILILLAVLALPLAAQERKITGTILDKDSKEPIEQATIQLLKSDSTYVGGALSDEKGNFTLKTPANGKYILRISSLGYSNELKSVTIADNKDVALGDVVMSHDAITLKETEVTGKAMKVVLKEDTFIYNASAYRTPEGSTIEELVKRLPGASIDDDGKITINGKEVTKILVDGKEFMTGDTKIAMKNLPTSIIEKVKAYDQKSDLTRISGIDDGEESTVLDFGIKKGMNRGMFSNIDLAAGNHDRYAGRIMGAYFNDKNRFMLFANANNVNDMGFPGGGGRGMFGRGRQGLTATKMLGVNYNFEEKNKLKIDLSAFWNHSDNDSHITRSTENFVSQTGSFSNSISQSYTRSNSINARGRLEWQPDTMTTILFRPSFSWSDNDSRSIGTSASFNADPYDYVDDPLDESSLLQMSADSLVVNSQNSNSISYSVSRSLEGMLMLNRRLSSNGRNITLRFNGGTTNNDGNSLTANQTRLWLMQTAAGLDSTYQTNRYSKTPTDSRNFRITATYSEPLFKGAYLQFRYSYRYSFSKSDRSTYDFSDVAPDVFSDITPTYRGWDSYLNRLTNPLESYLDDDLSRYSEYRNYINEFNLTFRLTRPKYNLNVGFMVQPQRSKYIQDYQGVHVDTVRTVTNFSPTLDFRYRFSKQHQLRMTYRGTTSQPSMTQLLDITDDSDPLNITKGNPGLKPSFTHDFHMDYNNYIENHMQFIGAGLNFSATRNSISDRVTYDEVTGGRTTQPENINGDWQIDGRVMYNTALDSLGYWNITTETSGSFVNNVAYLTLNSNSSSQKNRTRTVTWGQTLSGTYRNDWLEFILDGSLTYTHARNKLQSNSNLDTWQFAYGGSLTLTAPWGTALSTGLHENSRRGYSDNSMNTNELIWNAQLSQSFLKGKALTISLQLYDILHEQSNFSRTLSAIQRSDTWYNSINSYAMLHVIYRFNLFGGKDARMHGPRDRNRMDGPGSRRGPGGMPGGPGNRPRGGRPMM